MPHMRSAEMNFLSVYTWNMNMGTSFRARKQSHREAGWTLEEEHSNVRDVTYAYEQSVCSRTKVATNGCNLSNLIVNNVRDDG